jgi:DNA polymerase I-like protein with 3'-5' exonuclease and polymerase domains
MKIILDIETNSKHNVIWCCVTRDIDTDEVKVWKEANGLQKYLDQCDLIIGHNIIAFDNQVLSKTWNVSMRKNQLYDTLVSARLLDPSKEGGHSLDSWGKRLGYAKFEFSDWDSGCTAQMITYCIQDTLVTKKLYDYLLTEFNRQHFDYRSIELELNVQHIIYKQTENGFKLDERKAIELQADLTNKLVNIEASLQSIFPTKTIERISEKTGKKLADGIEVFNPGSRKQIGERLIEKGWKPKDFTDKGQPKVDETTLEGVDIPEAKAIAEYLMLQKRIAQISSWLKEMKEDGRVHGKVITNGAVTGRMTHMSPNMAQVPNSSAVYGHECRELWTVEKGYKLVGIDASGLELRMLAHYMKDDEYTTEVVSGDIHTANQRAAGLETRNQAKTFIYAFLYGAGASKIGKIVGGSSKEGERLISNFLKNTPKLHALRQTVSSLLSKEGTLPGLDGRRLQVRSEHSALNTLLQGAGAIVMKQALVILDDKLSKLGVDYKFVANVHDEWQIEVEDGYHDIVGKLGVQSIEQAGKKLNMNCPLTGEYRAGLTWKDTH